jgi:uncharacterized protein YcbK (DUF882 family)
VDRARRMFILGGGALLVAAPVSAAVRLPEGSRTAVPPVPTAVTRSAAPAVQTKPALDVRRFSLHNLHTGDRLKAVYWENGAYVDEVLDRARFVMRDWRNGEQHSMDNRLFDIFHELAKRTEADGAFQLISGYRSEGTNAALHAQSSGVAKRSLHMQGKAADIRIEGVQLASVRKAAISLGRGGVGYYPTSNFVHVDTGRVRQWAGS